MKTSNRFPQVLAIVMLLTTMFLIVTLFYGIMLAQNDTLTMNHFYIKYFDHKQPIITKSLKIKNSLLSTNPQEVTTYQKDIQSHLEIINKLLLQHNLTPINRQELVAIEESALLFLNEKSLQAAKDYLNKSHYSVKVDKFFDSIEKQSQTIKEMRQKFLSKSLRRNRIIVAVMTITFIIWMFVFVRLIWVIRKSIMERNNAYHEVVNARNEIQNLVRLLTHDISTPLQVLATYARIDTSVFDDKKKQTIQHRQKMSIQTIAEIIESVRQMMAMDDGKMSMDMSKVSIREVVDDVHDLFKDKLESKDIVIDVNLPAQDDFIFADRKVLKNQVLSNIISNCIKFSPSHSHLIIKTESDDHLVKLIIRDFGVGIPKDILQKLFDPTEKTTRQGTDGELGTGYGMPLVKTYLDSLQAQIEVESSTAEENPAGHGSTFTMTFLRA